MEGTETGLLRANVTLSDGDLSAEYYLYVYVNEPSEDEPPIENDEDSDDGYEITDDDSSEESEIDDNTDNTDVKSDVNIQIKKETDNLSETLALIIFERVKEYDELVA